MKGLNLNLNWVGTYQSSSEGKGFVTRGSPTSFMSIPKNQVDNIECVAQGFLYGALYGQGKQLDEVTFYPADTIKDVNTSGKPVYVFDLEDHYELETHFI